MLCGIGPVRFREAVREVVASFPEGSTERRVEVRASLVPFQGGQLMILTLVPSAACFMAWVLSALHDGEGDAAAPSCTRACCMQLCTLYVC